MESVLEIKLGEYRAPVWVKSPGLPLKPDEVVVVDIQKGYEFGTVLSSSRKVCEIKPEQIAGTIIRSASDSDLRQVVNNQMKAQDALKVCYEKVKQAKLDMQLVRAEYTFDATKVLFFFTSEGRVDFRNLVKDLAKMLRVRIELKQIGVRDRAKIVTGYGVCGRELCCSSFMKDFNSLSIKMAKEQGLPLNPQKISGVCGRVKCCMAYEFQVYREFSKNLPKLGAKIAVESGERGKVINVDILKRCVLVDLGEGKTKQITYPPLVHAP